MIKVKNMTSKNTGRAIANQFIITIREGDKLIEIFQSYNTVIAKQTYQDGRKTTELDRESWDYSATTGKYRNQFLGDAGIADTRHNIAHGHYVLTDLNGGN